MEVKLVLLVLHRPIKITKAICLECHSTAAAALSRIDFYSPNNGFGWKVNDIIGAQVLSVPASTVINKANRTTILIVGIVSVIFAFVLFLVNISRSV